METLLILCSIGGVLGKISCLDSLICNLKGFFSLNGIVFTYLIDIELHVKLRLKSVEKIIRMFN